jgi:SCP-2 sterol transfer family
MPAARARPNAAGKDPVSQFFAALAAPGHLATFEGESATLRFDLADGQQTDSWHVTVTDGDVSVTRQNAAADAIVRMARPRFEEVATGRHNAQAAMLRGLLTCEGSVAALVMFQRCFPGPPGSTGRVRPISGREVMKQRRPA